MSLPSKKVSIKDIEEVFVSEAQYFRALVRNRVYDPFERDDVLQEAFKGAIEGAERYQGAASVKLWIRGIVCNTAANFNRQKRSRMRMQSLPYAVVDNMLNEGVVVVQPYEFPDIQRREPIEVLAERDGHAVELRLERMVEEMSPKYRDIIEMRVYYGRSFVQIAEKHPEVSVRTLKKRFYAALEMLWASVTQDEQVWVG